MQNGNNTELVGKLRQRVIDLKKALEKYDPRNSEGEELELASYFYAIYVPEQDHKINSGYYL